MFVLETFGITRTSATNAGLIISLTLVMTPLVARSRVPPTFYVAAMLATLGVALLTQGNGINAPSLGDLLMLLAALARAVHIAAMHRMSADKPIDSRRLTLIQLATVALVFFAASLFVGDGVADTVGRLTPQGWIELAYLALACTVLAFCVQMWAVRRTSPARVGLLLGTEPMWAAAVGIALAGDRLTPVSATGAALILLATTWGAGSRCARASSSLAAWIRFPPGHEPRPRATPTAQTARLAQGSGHEGRVRRDVASCKLDQAGGCESRPGRRRSAG